jgi:uncharacterized protein (DUF1800 family)
MARCFTGWEVRHKKFNFNLHQHDNGVKSFLGTQGNFGGEDAVRIVLGQSAAARFIAKKLIRFFVFDEHPISDELAEPVAKSLRKTRFDFKAALRQIFSSQIFFNPAIIGSKIKSPVELAIGVLRYLGASTNMTRLAGQLEQLGQLPLFPPNVKGWDGGRSWINASTVLSRANLVRELVAEDSGIGEHDLATWFRAKSASHSGKNIEWLFGELLAVPPPADAAQAIHQLASQRNASNQQVMNIISAIGALPEFQLN